MKYYRSDGKKLVDVEYDDIPQMGDNVDGMLVISKEDHKEEYALFLLEPNGRVCCYVLDEIYILGKQNGFDNLVDAFTAYKNDEV